METFESGDLSRDFENGASKNTRVNGKNEYLNEYGGLCQPIVMWLIGHRVTCNRNGSRPDHSAWPHHPSKQTLSSCWLPLAWKAYRLTRIHSVRMNYCHVKITRVLFNNYNNVHRLWWKRIGVNAASPLCKRIQKSPYSYEASSCKRRLSFSSFMVNFIYRKLGNFVE